MKSLLKKIALMNPSVRGLYENSKQMQSQITNYELEITNYKSQITNCELEIANCKSQIMSHEEKITSQESQLENCEAHVDALSAEIDGLKDNRVNYETYFEDHYVSSAPSVQNAVDIFKDNWMSELPLDGIKSGSHRHFALDWRIKAYDSIVPVAGKKVLELGPFEGYDSYMLLKEGAASVTSIEGKTDSYIKCLIVKDLLNMSTDFRLGNFNEYLKDCPDRYDIVLASGVLYNMADPIQLINDISKVADVIYLWTYYYSKEREDKQFLFENTDPIILHQKYKAHKRVYSEEDLGVPYFCGGDKPFSMWLEKESVIDALKDAGFVNVAVHTDDALHESGSNLCIVASKAGSGIDE